MDYGNAICDSYEYTKSLIRENFIRWIVLAVGIIIFPIMIGYLIRVAKGEEEKPSLDNFGELFVQGIIAFIIVFIYGIIALIILGVIIVFLTVVFGGVFATGVIGSKAAGMSLLGGGPVMFAAMAAMYGCIFLLYAIGLPIGLAYSAIVLCALFRYARYGSFGESFNFDAITTHIRSIGWINFTMGLWVLQFFLAIVMYFIFAIVAFAAAPFIIGGWAALAALIIILGILVLLFIVPLEIFTIKYYSLLYDSAIPVNHE